MNKDRYNLLMKDKKTVLEPHEIDRGWHFCAEWDGLLIGPSMQESMLCDCVARTKAGAGGKDE